MQGIFLQSDFIYHFKVCKTTCNINHMLLLPSGPSNLR